MKLDIEPVAVAAYGEVSPDAAVATAKEIEPGGITADDDVGGHLVGIDVRSDSQRAQRPSLAKGG